MANGFVVCGRCGGFFIGGQIIFRKEMKRHRVLRTARDSGFNEGGLVVLLSVAVDDSSTAGDEESTHNNCEQSKFSIQVVWVGPVLRAHLTRRGEGSLGSVLPVAFFFHNRGEQGPRREEGQVEHPHKLVDRSIAFSFRSGAAYQLEDRVGGPGVVLNRGEYL